MKKKLHRLMDIYICKLNQRKIGGAVEAQYVRLRSGEEYHNPVFMDVDVSRGHVISLGMMDEDGNNLIINVNDISMVKELEHKLICQLKNEQARHYLLEETVDYLKKLCELNHGFVTPTFEKEALRLVKDISLKEINKQKINLPFKVNTLEQAI